MREILRAFFARVPNIGALRLAYMICALVPFLWLQDESAYTVRHEVIKTALNQEVSWYKFEEADHKSQPWCILSVSDISPQTALVIATKTSMISNTGGMVATGETKMDMADRVGCEGVDDRNIFWLTFGKTHAALRQDYIVFSITVWLTRLFYLYIMGVALGNILNRHFADNGRQLLREQTMNYLKYKKNEKKRRKNNITLPIKKNKNKE